MTYHLLEQNSRGMLTTSDKWDKSQNPKHFNERVQHLEQSVGNHPMRESSPKYPITRMEKLDFNSGISTFSLNFINDWTQLRQTVCSKCQRSESSVTTPSEEQSLIKKYSKIVEFRRQLLEYYGYELLEQSFADEVDPCLQIWKCKRLEQNFCSKDFMWVSYDCKMVCLKNELRGNQLSALNDKLLKESRLLIQFSHNNVVKVHQTIDLREPQTALSFYVCSLMDQMDGTLLDLMPSFPKDIKECELISKTFLRQIAKAIDYLHNRVNSGIRVSHLAINPSNIVWKVMDPICDDILFKLTNFKDCIVFEANAVDAYPYHSFANSPYSAPEALADCLGKATRPMDIYSLGKILAQLLLKDENMFERFKLFCAQPTAYLKPSHRSVFTSLSPQVRDLLTDMLWQNPNHRLTAEQICNHIWLK